MELLCCHERYKQKRKGIEGIIEIENPNLVKPKTVKARDIDVSFKLSFISCSLVEFHGKLTLFYCADWQNN